MLRGSSSREPLLLIPFLAGSICEPGKAIMEPRLTHSKPEGVRCIERTCTHAGAVQKNRKPLLEAAKVVRATVARVRNASKDGLGPASET